MAAVYYTEQKAWDLYNLGNDYPVSGYGYASAQIMSACAHGNKGDLDYYVSAWKWVPDVSAGGVSADGTPEGRFAIDETGLYSNPSGTELPFLFPEGTYGVTPGTVEDGKYTEAPKFESPEGPLVDDEHEPKEFFGDHEPSVKE